MSIAFWCLLVAGLLPFAVVGIAKWDKSYLRHNDQPREWETTLTGQQARAHRRALPRSRKNAHSRSSNLSF